MTKFSTDKSKIMKYKIANGGIFELAIKNLDKRPSFYHFLFQLIALSSNLSTSKFLSSRRHFPSLPSYTHHTPVLSDYTISVVCQAFPSWT